MCIVHAIVSTILGSSVWPPGCC